MTAPTVNRLLTIACRLCAREYTFDTWNVAPLRVDPVGKGGEDAWFEFETPCPHCGGKNQITVGAKPWPATGP